MNNNSNRGLYTPPQSENTGNYIQQPPPRQNNQGLTQSYQQNPNFKSNLPGGQETLQYNNIYNQHGHDTSVQNQQIQYEQNRISYKSPEELKNFIIGDAQQPPQYYDSQQSQIQNQNIMYLNNTKISSQENSKQNLPQTYIPPSQQLYNNQLLANSNQESNNQPHSTQINSNTEATNNGNLMNNQVVIF